ncbi:MAG TPA: hypothetical protein VGD22_11315 [Sphingobacteriaceae bacterium]
MKNLLIIFFSMMILSSCTTNVNKARSEDSTVLNAEAATDTAQLCFQKLEGTANQDTTYLKLIMNGSSVSGEFNHMPYEKDSRKGSISGSRNGDLIKAVWRYMQEGVTDSISVEFKLDGEHLLQKNLSVDPKTGRQYTSEASGYTMKYTKVKCKN